MLTVIQTPAAAGTDFNGTAPLRGLVDFLDLPISGNDERPIIQNVALKWTDGGALPSEINCFLQNPAGTATERLTIVRLTGADVTEGFSKLGCRIVVPVNATGVPWLLTLITTGKSVDASFIVSFSKGWAEPTPGS